MQTISKDARKASQLDQRDWLEAAWEEFAVRGIAAVTVQSIARKLGITRGSFYHHFADREDLLRGLLEHWRREWTTEVRDTIQALQLAPRQTLLALARLIRVKKASHYDVRVRAWALSDTVVREIVREADEVRLGFVRSQFTALGFDPIEAESRARLFLYYEMAEPAVLAEQSPEMEEELIALRGLSRLPIAASGLPLLLLDRVSPTLQAHASRACELRDRVVRLPLCLGGARLRGLCFSGLLGSSSADSASHGSDCSTCAGIARDCTDRDSTHGSPGCTRHRGAFRGVGGLLSRGVGRCLCVNGSPLQYEACLGLRPLGARRFVRRLLLGALILGRIDEHADVG
jgi:AcrR family transcriptional regulator